MEGDDAARRSNLVSRIPANSLPNSNLDAVANRPRFTGPWCAKYAPFGALAVRHCDGRVSALWLAMQSTKRENHSDASRRQAVTCSALCSGVMTELWQLHRTSARIVTLVVDGIGIALASSFIRGMVELYLKARNVEQCGIQAA